METRATARPGIKGDGTSPGSTGSLRQMRSRASGGVSPRRGGGLDRSHDEVSSGEEDLDGNCTEDEVDRIAPRPSPPLYPSLSPKSDSGPEVDLSPNSKRLLHSSSEEIFIPGHSHCTSRKGPVSTRKRHTAEIPRTPEKGSPGRKLYPDLNELSERRKKRGLTPILSIGILILIFCCLLTFIQSLKNLEEIPRTHPYIKPIEAVYQDIKRHLKEIKRDFSQTKHFWVQLLGQLETIMIDKPLQPAVILSVVPQGAEETAVCLLHKISQAISDGFEDDMFVMYDVISEVRKGKHNLKRHLFEYLGRLQDSHAAIVHNVETIPGEAAMTFHAFCDNENAPFKQAIIFLEVRIPGKYEEDLSWERLGNTVDNYLKGRWGEELKEKDVSAVVSRVANAPVLIKPESPSVLDAVCRT